CWTIAARHIPQMKRFGILIVAGDRLGVACEGGPGRRDAVSVRQEHWPRAPPVQPWQIPRYRRYPLPPSSRRRFLPVARPTSRPRRQLRWDVPVPTERPYSAPLFSVCGWVTGLVGSNYTPPSVQRAALTFFMLLDRARTIGCRS